MASIKSSKRKRNRPGDLPAVPLFCDFTCPYAALPPVDTSGACRRELAVYCSYLEKYNNKNNMCLVRNRDGA
jgi:hypothetical protein